MNWLLIDKLDNGIREIFLGFYLFGEVSGFDCFSGINIHG
jgi:hypothetical protein